MRDREREQRVKQSVTSQPRSIRHNWTRTTMKLLLLVSFLSLWRRSDGTGAAPIEVVVKEGDDAILNCSFSSKNIRQELFDWNKDKKGVFMYDKGELYKENDNRQDEQFKGRVFHFPEHLDEGNASIVIRATKLTDSGNYTCLFPKLDPIRRSNVELVVDPILKDRSDENISGAAPKPVITRLEETKDWSRLSCEVLGAFPKPKVYWQDGEENIVRAEEPQVTERGGRYDIILQTTVNKTDFYRCVSTQEEIHHEIYTETHVYIGGAAPEPHINDAGGTVPVWVAAVGAVSLALIVSVVVGVVVYFVQKKKTHSAVPSNSG